jgi:putative oxidoreductase
MNTLITNLKNPLDLAGRVLLAAIFLLAGLQKVGGYDGTAAYMASVGVPGALLPAVIALEIGGALAIIAGFQTRLVAILLAGFSGVAALLFHANFADPMQSILFLKNLSIAGGFLVLAANGPGAWSVDARHR